MNAARWAVALLISGAGLWFALKGTHWNTLPSTLTNLQSGEWLLLYPVVLFFEYLMRTIRWKILLNPFKRTSLKILFPVTAAGFFINNVLPFRVGELARTYWTCQKLSVPFSSCLTILVVDRVFDMMSLLTLLLLVLFQKFSLYRSTAAVWLFGAATLFALATLILMARFPVPFKQWAERPWIPKRLTHWTHQFVDGAKALRESRVLFMSYVLSLLFWLMNVGFLKKMAGVFSLTLSWSDSAWLMIAFCMGAFLPSAPGYVGTVEAAGVAALQLLGFERSTSLPFILVIHLSQILSSLLWGLPSLWVAGLRLEKGTPKIQTT